MPQDSEYQDLEVKAFGGGLNFSQHPAYIRDDEWSWCENVYARLGSCECARPIESKITAMPGAFAGTILGLLVNPEDFSIMFVVGCGASDELYLYRLDASVVSPSLTEITPATSRAKAGQTSHANIAFLNGYTVINGGYYAGATVTSLIHVSGSLPTTYALITPASGALAADHLVSFAGRIVTGNCNREDLVDGIEGRRLVWSDANDPLTWVPSVGNSADDTILDSPEGLVNGLLRVGPQLLLVLTPGSIYSLTPTRAIPAFASDLVTDLVGAWSKNRGGPGTFGKVPGGGVIVGAGDIYLVGAEGLKIISAKIAHYVRELLNAGASLAPSGFVQWHPGHDQIIISPLPSASGNQTALCYNPHEDAWSRLCWQTLVKVGETQQPFWMSNSCVMPDAYHSNLGDWWLNQANTEILWRECASSVFAASSTCKVITKIFHFGHSETEIESILVDWECLTNKDTDILSVEYWGSSQFSDSVLGNPGGQFGGGTLTAIGNLTGGSSELPIRKSARYHRFSFSNTQGRFRIRGFKLKLAPRGDRAKHQFST